MNLHLPSLLPETYIGDVQTRLSLYKRIAAAADAEALGLLQAEIGDRFGPLPEPAVNLLQSARLTLRCRELGLRRLDITAQSSHVLFAQNNRVDPAVVIGLVQREPRVFRLEGPLKLRISRGVPDAERFAVASNLLDRLGAGRGATGASQ